jgi:hypothetical protein
MQEGVDKFYCEAKDLDEAEEFAEMYNAVVLGKVPYDYVNRDVNPENIPLSKIERV